MAMEEKILPAKLLRLTEGLHSLPDKPEPQPSADYPGTQVCTQKLSARCSAPAVRAVIRTSASVMGRPRSRKLRAETGAPCL